MSDLLEMNALSLSLSNSLSLSLSLTVFFWLKFFRKEKKFFFFLVRKPLSESILGAARKLFTRNYY